MKTIVIIGGGIAGIEAAAKLNKQGVKVYLIEQNAKIGGHLAQWDRLFPLQEKAEKVLNELIEKIDTLDSHVEILTNTNVQYINPIASERYEIILSGNKTIEADAIIFATGFDTFKASRKEEYGYGIYDNVFTSVDLEEMFRKKNVVCKNGSKPERIALIHCVGSRDEKVNNRYCSKVCCVTAVKQAMELKELYPEAEVYNFYMDLRMFDRYFENMYHEAQSVHGVQFVRGRLSEAAETKEGKIQLKAEDTLLGKPVKLTVDMLILMVGMEASQTGSVIAQKTNLSIGSDRFFNTMNDYDKKNYTAKEGIFMAGTCTGPKTIPDTLADARAAAVEVMEYLSI